MVNACFHNLKEKKLIIQINTKFWWWLRITHGAVQLNFDSTKYRTWNHLTASSNYGFCNHWCMILHSTHQFIQYVWYSSSFIRFHVNRNHHSNYYMLGAYQHELNESNIGEMRLNCCIWVIWLHFNLYEFYMTIRLASQWKLDKRIVYHSII